MKANNLRDLFFFVCMFGDILVLIYYKTGKVDINDDRVFIFALFGIIFTALNYLFWIKLSSYISKNK